VPYSEIMVFNKTSGEAYGETYTPAIWSETSVNMAIGPLGKTFKQGTYGPPGSLYMMGCVDYDYGGGSFPEYACDNDNGRNGIKGHLTDYAGEACAGGRLDGTWAWTDGTDCKYRGQMYTWGFAIR